ncbi:NAD(P)/FAD-dependent oxidoreductase [Flavobacterium sp. MK4S-17]|uniref:NAD(P)/FAD-dependent oxidoreductase n=1 Tax=Flavobacterium sp. MK4S-17 TaxID=2543737 RepID=UPI0013587773|nr:NAD(P)/FAD-dependent oxidoreductase [Flavobacterium sp. MK4S-17]
MGTSYEVIIIGGSYAGLSAAMALGRASRNVLVIDSGKPCNATTPHSHNFLTQDGETPAAISLKAKEQVLQYPTVLLKTGKAIKGEKLDNRFIITTEANEIYSSDKLLFTSGVTDVMPDIPGFSECWGKTVIHCPYCHGYEAKDLDTAVIANGDAAYHYSMLLPQWAKSLTLFTNGKANFTDEQLNKLRQKNIPVIETEIASLHQDNGQLKDVILNDGSKHQFQVAYHKPTQLQHSDIPEQLGCTINEYGILITDEMQKTNIYGIYAAGDCSALMRSVANAVASGNKAGALINMELCVESFNKVN